MFPYSMRNEVKITATTSALDLRDEYRCVKWLIQGKIFDNMYLAILKNRAGKYVDVKGYFSQL